MPFMFEGSIFLQELINRQETTSDLDLKLVLDDFNHNTTATKLIDALRMWISHKHHFELLYFWKVVDII